MWTCSRSRASVLRTMAPEKGRVGGGLGGVSSAEQYPTAPAVHHSSALLASMGQNRVWAQGWEEQNIHLFGRTSTLWCTTGFPQGLPSCPGAQSRAGCSSSTTGLCPDWGGSQPCALKQLDRVTLRGKVAQLASGVLSICFAHFQNQSWLKKFFSSCRNLQSLAHSPICHFVLHHALFQEVELPMIS